VTSIYCIISFTIIKEMIAVERLVVVNGPEHLYIHLHLLSVSSLVFFFSSSEASLVLLLSPSNARVLCGKIPHNKNANAEYECLH